MRTRPTTAAMRWLAWAALLGLVALLVSSGVVLLELPPGTDTPETVEVAVQTHGAAPSMATMVRQGDRWLGRVADFPASSVAHVQPRRSPGFLVRAASGGFRAYADRSPHRGQPLEYRDPMPGTANHADGPQPGAQ